ncbi:MAG: DUF5666 domain-containing protein [Anaeromyxobacteraceae bacterium]
MISKTQPSRNTLSKLLLALVASSFVAACGGSAGPKGDGNGPAATGPTSRGAISAITAAGFTVNGTTYRVAGARLSMPDEAVASVTLASNADLSKYLVTGMIVTVRAAGTAAGALSEGSSGGEAEAAEVEFEHEVEGEVEAHDANSLDVLGHHVSMDDDTNVVDRHGDKVDRTSLTAGTRVEVSGHGDGKGGLSATMVRVRDDRQGEDQEVKGWVVAVSGTTVDLSFSKGGTSELAIDVSKITPAPVIAVDDFLEVKTDGSKNDAGALFALSVKQEDEREDESEHQGEHEVEGIVTNLTLTGFSIGDTKVSYSASTSYVGGTADDLVEGVKVEVEGAVGQDGVLAASKIQFKASVRIEANVEARDETAGTITVLGLKVNVTPSTQGLGVAAATVGTAVEVRGTMSKDGTAVNATRFELKDFKPANRAFLRGLVTAKTASSVTIAGIVVDLSKASLNDLAEGGMTLEAFLAAVTPGTTIVKARWRPYPDSTSAPADEAELDN